MRVRIGRGACADGEGIIGVLVDAREELDERCCI